MIVLVTDGEQRAALALVRALGRAGHRVIVSATSSGSIAGASRFARAEVTTPDPLTAPEAFADAVRALLRRWDIEVLLPVSEAALLALLPERERLAPARLPFPSIDCFRRVADKRAVLDVASRLGIAVPEQWVLESPGERGAWPKVAPSFPLVVKPARSIGEAGGHRARFGVRRVADAAELTRRLATLPAAAFPILLQRVIVGPGIGVFLLLWDGHLAAAFAHRRLREKPPGGGVSVYRESIAADPALVDRSRALLEHFGWRGVAMVEYKRDERTGTPYLMEVNGRFWGSLQLAIDAGVDFPNLLLDVSGGMRMPPPRYRVGVRSRWWWGDVDQLLTRLRRSSAELVLPPDAPSRWRAVRDFLALWRPGDRNEILRLDDPRPFVRETAQWLAGR